MNLTLSFFVVSLVSLLSIQLGRTLEARDIEKQFLEMEAKILEMRIKVEQNWMSCEKGK